MRNAKWLWAALALLGGLIAAATVAADAGDAEVLRRVETALATTYYQGLLVTVRGFGTGREDEVARAWFGPRGQQALEIVTPSWRGGERFITDGVEAWVVYPDCGAALRLPAADRERPLGLVKGAFLEGNGRVGERPALVLRWQGRSFLRRVWIDAERYVPLKREDTAGNGDLMLSQTLTGVTFLTSPAPDRFSFIPGAALSVFIDEAAFHQAASLQHVQRGVDFRLCQPSFLPPDFVFRRAFLRQLPQLVVVQLRYSDGRDRAISLFEYRVQKFLAPPERQFIAEFGAGRQARLNFLRWRRGKIEFVLVASFPPTILREVAKSVR